MDANDVGGNILLFPLIFAVGLASLAYASLLRRRGRADPYYTIVGVLAVYMGAVGSLIF